MLNAGAVASIFHIFRRSVEGRFVDPLFQLFVAPFWPHFGVPKLMILGSIFGPPKKSAPKAKKTRQFKSDVAKEQPRSTKERWGATLGRTSPYLRRQPLGPDRGTAPRA